MATKFFTDLKKKISYLFMSESVKRNKKIEKQLLEDKTRYIYLTHEALIMGPPRSGKSTFFQQLKRLYINDDEIDEKTKKERRDDIRKYVTDSIIDILNAIPLPVTSLKILAAAVWLKHNLKKPECFEERSDLPKKFFNLSNFFNYLWQDAVMRRYLQIYGGCHLKDNLEYFFDKIDVIFKNDYVPTVGDVLRCPVFSANMEELKMHLIYDGNINDYIFIDTGRGKNKLLMKNLSWKKNNSEDSCQKQSVKYIIIFMIDCSSPEQLYSSLITLESIVHSAYTFCYKIYNILNKVDVFKKRILSGESVESFFIDFPDFSSFYSVFNNNFEPRNVWENEENREVVAGIEFVKQKLEDVYDEYYDRYFSLNHVLGTSFYSGVLSDKYIRSLIFDYCLCNRHTYVYGRFF